MDGAITDGDDDGFLFALLDVGFGFAVAQSDPARVKTEALDEQNELLAIITRQAIKVLAFLPNEREIG